MKNTFKTISTKKINKIMTTRGYNPNSEYWNRVFIDDTGYCYFLNAFQITRIPAFLVDLNDPNLKSVFIEDLEDKSAIENMMKLFYETVTSAADLVNDYKDVFTVDRFNLKNQLAYIKKEYKKEYHGIAAAMSPFALKFGKKEDDYKALVNAQYLLDLLYLHPDRDIKIIAGNPLKPLVIGNGNDEILSILMPTRGADISKTIYINEV